MNSGKGQSESNFMKYLIAFTMVLVILLGGFAFFLGKMTDEESRLEVSIEHFYQGDLIGYIYFVYHVNANGYLLIHVNNQYEQARYFLANIRDSTQLRGPLSVASTYYSFLFIKEGHIEIYQWVNLTYPEDTLIPLP
ncbi:MAG: hypothetical protein ACXAEL_08300 [Candidatus Hodarchaeales archaeon]|jgi:hypothetical protein